MNKGSIVLSSGIIMFWEHQVGARSDGLRAWYFSEPTQTDIDEGMRELEAMKPDKSSTILKMVDLSPGSDQRSKSILDAFSGGGSRN